MKKTNSKNKPKTLNPEPDNVIYLEPLENDLEMRIHNTLMRVRKQMRDLYAQRQQKNNAEEKIDD